jgi:hypothetical protein
MSLPRLPGGRAGRVAAAWEMLIGDIRAGFGKAVNLTAV